MPITPFHFGPAGTVALLARKYIDLPAFILVNVIIDIEPSIVILFGLGYPIHRHLHTFLIGSFIATFFAILLYFCKGYTVKIMKLLNLPYEPVFLKILVSSILGAWLHVFFDAPLYSDIRPFFPSFFNPLYGILSYFQLYLLCTLFFIPALVLYFRVKTPK
ncbi:MAG: hypothetical protein NTW64_03190 [Candidatus Omnitrophica bacterium]|nr:hypothetical protein [Candidatus Omnitrophota bacterium]